MSGGLIMKKLIRKIIIYFEDRKNWKMKMSDPIIFKLVSSNDKK